VHQSLGLGRTDVEDGAGVPEEGQDVGVGGSDVRGPGDEASIKAEVFHSDVLFDADGEAVQGSYRCSVGGEVGVEEGGAGEGLGGEEGGYAVRLGEDGGLGFI
jgi:hypothetical protein